MIAAFDPIVMRALQRDPDQRYPTAKEMATDLEGRCSARRGYGGKNDKIAKYMQATFASHIEARKRLLQEVSSKAARAPPCSRPRSTTGAAGSGLADRHRRLLAAVQAEHDRDQAAAGPADALARRPRGGRVNPFAPGVMMGAAGAGRGGRSGRTRAAERGARARRARRCRIEYPRAVPSDLPPIARPDSQPGEDYAGDRR